MARLKMNRRKRTKKLAALSTLWSEIISLVNWYFHLVNTMIVIHICITRPRYKMLHPERKKYMQRLVYESDETCLQHLRLNRTAFVKLRRMVEIDGKLMASKYLQIDEQVAIFLYVLAHHVKNRVAKFQFRRSGETVNISIMYSMLLFYWKNNYLRIPSLYQQLLEMKDGNGSRDVLEQ